MDAYVNKYLLIVKEGVRRFGAVAKLLLIGDSVMYRIARNTTFWREMEVRYAAITLAVPGDRTENIIYRLSSGLHKNITSNPLIILSAGSTNVGLGRVSPFTVVSYLLNSLKITYDIHINPRG